MAGRYVLEYLRDNGESGRGDLIEGTGKYKHSTIDKALKNLKDLGLVERANEGGKGIAATYDLTEEGEEYT